METLNSETFFCPTLKGTLTKSVCIARQKTRKIKCASGNMEEAGSTKHGCVECARKKKHKKHWRIKEWPKESLLQR